MTRAATDPTRPEEDGDKKAALLFLRAKDLLLDWGGHSSDVVAEDIDDVDVNCPQSSQASLSESRVQVELGRDAVGQPAGRIDVRSFERSLGVDFPGTG